MTATLLVRASRHEQFGRTAIGAERAQALPEQHHGGVDGGKANERKFAGRQRAAPTTIRRCTNRSLRRADTTWRNVKPAAIWPASIQQQRAPPPVLFHN
jgi:hypothetical protein